MKTKTPMKTMTMTSIPILSPQLEWRAWCNDESHDGVSCVVF
jgi:hypothetical protein